MTAGSRLASTVFSVDSVQSQPSEVERGGSSCVRCGDEYSTKLKEGACTDVGAALSVCADSEMCDRRISQLHLMGIA
jgi:alpha-D-ribose 1-methylphosphonate 5-phosphate C-P lyase